MYVCMHYQKTSVHYPTEYALETFLSETEWEKRGES